MNKDDAIRLMKCFFKVNRNIIWLAHDYSDAVQAHSWVEKFLYHGHADNCALLTTHVVVMSPL